MPAISAGAVAWVHFVNALEVFLGWKEFEGDLFHNLALGAFVFGHRGLYEWFEDTGCRGLL